MLSFVVPAYNEERYLPATLASIHEAARAMGEPYEIVVANDHSSDGTAQVAQAGGARVVTVQKRQIAATRNAGAAAAAGDVLFFVDADTRVTEAVVRAALEALGAGAIGGGAGVRFHDGPAWAQRDVAMLTRVMRWCNWAAGCFVFARRDAFDAVGGFDERFFASEEIHFSRAMKRRGRFVVLRECVRTSARKAETHTRWAMIKMLWKIALRGEKGVQTRELTSFWYPDKR